MQFLVSEDVTNLSSQVGNIDLTGIARNSTAIDSLTTRADQDSDRLSTEAAKVTTLQSNVANLEAAESVNATAIQSLTTQVAQKANTSDVTAVSQAVTELEANWMDSICQVSCERNRTTRTYYTRRPRQ